MDALQLIEMTEARRAAFRLSPNALGDLLGLSVPSGWPEFPDALSRPTAPGWPIFLFIDSRQKAILGHGGFLSAPDQKNEVQIGYEVAPEHRGLGIATAAMKEVLSACTARAIATTFTESGPSVSVLKKLDFSSIGTHALPDGTKIWMWAKLKGAAV